MKLNRARFARRGVSTGRSSHAQLLDQVRERDVAIDQLVLERAVFVEHLARERSRSEALQEELDRLNARYARMQLREMSA